MDLCLPGHAIRVHTFADAIPLLLPATFAECVEYMFSVHIHANRAQRGLNGHLDMPPHTGTHYACCMLHVPKNQWCMLMLYASHASRAHSIAHSTPNDPYEAHAHIDLYRIERVLECAAGAGTVALNFARNIYYTMRVRPSVRSVQPFVRKDGCCVHAMRCARQKETRTHTTYIYSTHKIPKSAQYVQFPM